MPGALRSGLALGWLIFAGAGGTTAAEQPPVAQHHPGLAEGPSSPGELGKGARPRVTLLTARWCQWCRVLEAVSLPDPRVQRALRERFEGLVVDVDRAPRWMDLTDVAGLPALVFFDEEGRHVLTKSGFREPADLAALLEAVAEQLAGEGLAALSSAPELSRLPAQGLSPAGAASALARYKKKLYFQVSSNDGGFQSPSRHPYPELLLELQRTLEVVPDDEVERWISLTTKSALAGTSPRLRGEPARDMDYDGRELSRLAREGPKAGQRWREGVERLPSADPYLGAQDPFDHGVFRYAAGPGWYHPHFERSALDNLAWVLLLEARGRPTEAGNIRRFVARTFAPGGGPLLANQASDPFYYRLHPEERAGVPPPPVAPLVLAKVQARGARVDERHCAALARVRADAWPSGIWAHDAGDVPATEDEVGELLLALASCPDDGLRQKGRELSRYVLRRWSERGLERSPRLHRLAAGVCEADPGACTRALAAVSELPLDLRFAPPLAQLTKLAHRAP